MMKINVWKLYIHDDFPNYTINLYTEEKWTLRKCWEIVIKIKK